LRHNYIDDTNVSMTKSFDIFLASTSLEDFLREVGDDINYARFMNEHKSSMGAMVRDYEELVQKYIKEEPASEIVE
ncbi:MAG: hypothetical protein PHU14_08950, partial [Methylovulum sp.]|nr:hypothetical protein [Methylovulum sp.]